ncbi:hydroxyacid dehydrogenase [Verrucomicrobia bacterium SCGC AG-212-E04]|nr:hydroxyacid dehydrogenase [Verrucomicrobia bacterium SCGC AG-212-E04]
MVPLSKTILLVIVVLMIVAYSSLAERKVSAYIQDRVGPNRVGLPLTLLGFKKDFSLGGLAQPMVDGLKFLLKEDLTPAHVNKFYYWLAPALAVAPALLSIAVVPFGSTLTLFGNTYKMVVADVNIGFLYVFAITSISVYGIVIAGWSANSKYPFFGGVRSSAQMISYELSMGLSLVPVLLIIGNLNLSGIVEHQAKEGWMALPFTNLAFGMHETGAWISGFRAREVALWIPMLISFLIFTVSIFAETNRAPFDLPESEQELVAGYHTEYSSMKFALFFLGEYAAMITGCALIATLFLGGWQFPIPSIEFHSAQDWTFALVTKTGADGNAWGVFNIICFFGKVIALILFFMFVRWTVPRFRYDQLMKLGWVVFFELALANIVFTAIVLAIWPK